MHVGQGAGAAGGEGDGERTPACLAGRFVYDEDVIDGEPGRYSGDVRLDGQGVMQRVAECGGVEAERAGAAADLLIDATGVEDGDVLDGEHERVVDRQRGGDEGGGQHQPEEDEQGTDALAHDVAHADAREMRRTDGTPGQR